MIESAFTGVRPIGQAEQGYAIDLPPFTFFRDRPSGSGGRGHGGGVCAGGPGVCGQFMCRLHKREKVYVHKSK